MGVMMTGAAQTEFCVETGIAGCVGIDAEYGQAITTHMAMPLRFSVLKSAAEIRIDDLDALDELDDLIERLEQAFGKRNDIVHHAWCRDPDTNKVFTVKESARVSVQTDLIPMSVNQLKNNPLFLYQPRMNLISFLIFP